MFRVCIPKALRTRSLGIFGPARKVYLYPINFPFLIIEVLEEVGCMWG